MGNNYVLFIEIPYANSNLVQDVDLTIEAMFDMMKNTYQVLEEKINLPNFYKETTKKNAKVYFNHRG